MSRLLVELFRGQTLLLHTNRTIMGSNILHYLSSYQKILVEGYACVSLLDLSRALLGSAGKDCLTQLHLVETLCEERASPLRTGLGYLIGKACCERSRNYGGCAKRRTCVLAVK